MDNLPSSATGAINRGAAAYRAGRLEDARALFVHALHLDSESEKGWLWLATLSEDPAEKRYCLNRALTINPESVGFARLTQLPPGPSSVPDDLTDLIPPPLPPDLADVGGVPLPLLPRNTVVRHHRSRATRTASGADGEAEAQEAARRTPGWKLWLPAIVLLLVAAVAVAAFLVRREGPIPRRDAYVIAFAGPLSGVDAANGQEQLDALELAVHAVNERGGIARHPLEVLAFDDQNDPELAAQRAREIVENDRVLLVIGHEHSEASEAAAPIYEEAGLAAITPASTADILTEGNPWYFRTIFDNHDQGELIAAYSQHALQHDRASIVTTEGLYESSLADAFSERFAVQGTIVARWILDTENMDASIASMIEELQAADDPGILFLSLHAEEAEHVLLALRRAGISMPMISGDSLGFEDFNDRFADEPEEQVQPGFFTNGLYVASPLIYDSLGGDALAFSQRFWEVYGKSPEWFGAKAYDTATLAVHALTGLSEAGINPGDIAAERQQVRDVLAATNSIENAVPGLSGPLYFDDENTVPQALSFGYFDLGSLLSAPLQYRAVINPDSVDLDAAREAGRVFDIHDQPFLQYRVVYVGVDLNEITNLDARAQTFDADFFLWFRYRGDDAVENVIFTNNINPETALPDPIDRSEVNGENFVMYRIHETFTDPLNFTDFPWDKHLLTLSMQNRTRSQNQVVYVPDQANLRQTQAERLRSGANINESFNRIPSWIVERVFYSQDSSTVRSTTPDPRTGAPEYEQFSTYEVQMAYGRDVESFLIKNLLPLGLLGLVTYVSIFFPPSEALRRIGFSFSGVLTASVMLQSISSSLPEVGYTVAIEWGYYIFIGMSAFLVLVNITVDYWYKGRRYVAARQLDRIARVAYPGVLLLTAAAYAIMFW